MDSYDTMFHMKNEGTDPCPPAADWKALAALSGAVAVLFLNTSALNVALPVLSVDLDASTGEQQWLIAVYNLVFAAALVPGGFLGDRFGHRRVLLSGASLFLVGCVTGAIAPSVGVLMVGRALMGCGASVFTPMSMAMIPSLFAPQYRQRAMTVWTLVTVLATPLGPLVGGGLVTLWGWRTIFVFDLLAMGIALACIVRAVPASSAEPAGAVSGQAGSRVWGGGVAMALAVTVVTAGLIRMGEDPAVVPAGILVLAGTVLLAAIVVLDLRSGDPVIGFGLFADRRFALAALVLGLLNVVLYGLIFVLPSYLQTVLGHSAMVGSAFLLPLLLGAILAGSATEHVVRRHGAIRTCLSSVVALGAGLGAMAWGIGDKLLAGVLIGEFVVGSGAGIGQSTAMALGMDHIPSASRGRGSALLNVLRTFGSVLGVTMIGGVSGLVYLRRLPQLLPGSAVKGDLGTTVAQTFDAADREPPVLADAIRAAAGTAYADALVWALLMGVAVSMIVGVACLALGRGRSRGQISEEPQA